MDGINFSYAHFYTPTNGTHIYTKRMEMKEGNADAVGREKKF